MTAELQKAKEKIEDLDDVLKVKYSIDFSKMFIFQLQEKDKIINRHHIYSRRHQQNVKHSVSTGNLSLFDEESVVTRLDNKLKEFENKKNNSSNSESNIYINCKYQLKKNGYSAKNLICCTISCVKPLNMLETLLQ